MKKPCIEGLTVQMHSLEVADQGPRSKWKIVIAGSDQWVVAIHTRHRRSMISDDRIGGSHRWRYRRLHYGHGNCNW